MKKNIAIQVLLGKKRQLQRKASTKLSTFSFFKYKILNNFSIYIQMIKNKEYDLLINLKATQLRIP